MSLPPWIKSIKRPLDKVAAPPRRAFEDLPDTEPGEELGERGRTPVGRVPKGTSARHDVPDDASADDPGDDTLPIVRAHLKLV